MKFDWRITKYIIHGGYDIQNSHIGNSCKYINTNNKFAYMLNYNSKYKKYSTVL